MTSALQALQAKIAGGDKAAYASQIEQLKAIGAAIEAAKPEVWQAKSETDAAVVYLLSGGRTGDITRLLQSGSVPQSETPLMRGALAYIVGDQAQASTLLGEFDPRSLDLRLAGQIAFVQSVLAAPHDPKKATALLDLARLLAPGGLVEEASLRREIALVADQHDIDRFTMLSRQYAMRFGRSVYADRFLQGLAYKALDAQLVRDVPSFQKFHSFVTSLTPRARSRFLLTVARAEAIDGKFAVASAAAGEALQEAPSDSVQEARGKLYQASARILTPEYDQGLVELQSVAEAKLDERDQSLLGAVRDVAARLRLPLSEPPDGSPAPAGVKGGEDPAAATIALAEEALSRTAGDGGAAGKGNP
jgi:chemotaxis protein MotC